MLSMLFVCFSRGHISKSPNPPSTVRVLCSTSENPVQRVRRRRRKCPIAFPVQRFAIVSKWIRSTTRQALQSFGPPGTKDTISIVIARDNWTDNIVRVKNRRADYQFKQLRITTSSLNSDYLCTTIVAVYRGAF